MMFPLFPLCSHCSGNAWRHAAQGLGPMFPLFPLGMQAHTRARAMVCIAVGTVGTVGTYTLTLLSFIACVFPLVFPLVLSSGNILHLLGRPWGVLLSCSYPAPLVGDRNKGADARRILTLRVVVKRSPAMAGGFEVVHPEGVRVIDRHNEGLSMAKEMPLRPMGPPSGGRSDVGASSTDFFVCAVVQRDCASKGGGRGVSNFATRRGA